MFWAQLAFAVNVGVGDGAWQRRQCLRARSAPAAKTRTFPPVTKNACRPMPRLAPSTMKNTRRPMPRLSNDPVVLRFSRWAPTMGSEPGRSTLCTHSRTVGRRSTCTLSSHTRARPGGNLLRFVDVDNVEWLKTLHGGWLKIFNIEIWREIS